MDYPVSKRMIACVMAFAIALIMLPSVAFAADHGSKQTVKVAVLNNSEYADLDENGIWTGSDIETMITVAQKAGFNVEFIDSSSDPDFLGNLANGTYDIVADVVKTENRDGRFIFNDDTLGTVNSTLAVKADDDRWDYGNIEQINDMKVGVIATYANNADFRSWCRKHNITPVIKEYTDIKTMTAALDSGEIDGEVYTAGSGESYTENYRTILKFLPEAYYYAFRKSDVSLKNKVDTAIAQILSENPDYFTNLKNKYEIQFNNNKLPFSSEEKKYIVDHKNICIAVVKNDLPFYSYSSTSGDQGIIPDYYALIAKHTGFKFKYKAYDTRAAAIKAVKSGKADILGIFNDGIISAYSSGLTLTSNIYTADGILLTKAGNGIDDVKTVAAKQNAGKFEDISVKRAFPKAKLKSYETATQCFRALRAGDVDGVLVGLPSATWIINQTNSQAYSIIPVSGVVYELCSGVLPENKLLCSILNKSIAGTKASFTGIVTRNTLTQSDWKTTVAKMPPAISIAVVATLLALIIILIWSLIMLRRRQKERVAVFASQAEAEQKRIRAEAIEKSAEEKNAFFSNISHDMRTPLNAVIGFAGLGEMAEDASQKDEYFSKIKASGKLLNSLIDDTLTLSKISSGKLVLNLEPTRPSELFNVIVDLTEHEAKAKGIIFTADMEGTLDDSLMMDRLNVQKIFLNLLSNAVKYTKPGGHIGLKIYTDYNDGSMTESVLEVSDDGIGISEEYLPHIFEPFSQEKRKGYESVGTGLGLSIVSQLVELMHGTIDVKSEKDKGTIFVIRLHFDRAEAGAGAEHGTGSEPETAAGQIADAGSGAAGHGTDAEPNTGAGNAAAEMALEGGKNAAESALTDLAGLNILLCEDNRMNTEIAVALLENHGMTVTTAANGAEGVEKFAASKDGEFDAVLMDLRMPEMDGYEATRKIREMDRMDAVSIPIIAMTADAFADDVKNCLDAGMDEHIAKPIEPDRMYAVISKTVCCSREKKNEILGLKDEVSENKGEIPGNKKEVIE